MPAAEFLEHLHQLQISRAEERQWQLSVADFPKLTGRDGARIRTQIWRRASQVAIFGDLYDSPFHGVPDDAKIRMMGANLQAATADKWSRTHQQHLHWLKQKGLTVEDAIQRYREWVSGEKDREFDDRGTIWIGGGLGAHSKR